MVLCIAGGRSYRFTNEDIVVLDEIVDKYNITKIISGGASGVDKCAQDYAQAAQIPFGMYGAEWARFGRSAGHIRNRDMAINADVVVLFPGGKGTASMRGFALAHDCIVLDYGVKQ